MKNYRIIKGKKIHVNQLASMSRKYTVNNNTIHQLGGNGKNYVHIWREIRTARFDTPVYGNTYEVDKDGHYHLVEHDSYWTPVSNPQPKRLIKKKAHKNKKKRNDFVAFFPNYPYTLPKMNKIQYCEKLVEHKLTKWERKNPKPMDMFTEDVEKWNQLRENMRERFRDFVVSIYDPLIIMGNRVNVKKQRMDANKIAEVKDVDGKGHDVSFPNLSTEDKLYKNAESAAKNAMKKDTSILDADLMNHKRNQKRPLLGAKRTTLADKKLKKAA